MTHHVNYLYFEYDGELREIINGARTIEHLRTADAACYQVTIKDTDCGVLSLDQTDYDTILEFTTPDAAEFSAPWYDGTPGSPSSKGYGFWIDEWTGLDGAHMRRGAAGNYPRGAVFGELGQPHRTWKFNISLFGADEVALEDLFRWLEQELLQNCVPGATAWIRTACPDGYDNDYGLAHVIDVQMLEGLEWIEPPIEGLGCFMRAASFTLGVADPCLYKPPTLCLEAEEFPAVDLCSLGIAGILGCPGDEDHFSDYRLCCAVAATRIGVTAPVVVVQNLGASSYSPPLRLVGVAGASCEIGSNEVLGEVRVSGIPPQSELMIDAARRRVLWRETGDTLWEPGYTYLDRSMDFVPEYPAIGTTAGHVFIEPTTIATSLADLRVTTWMVGRYGCC